VSTKKKKNKRAAAWRAILAWLTCPEGISRKDAKTEADEWIGYEDAGILVTGRLSGNG
jgi:hypothetical protein